MAQETEEIKTLKAELESFKRDFDSYKKTQDEKFVTQEEKNVKYDKKTSESSQLLYPIDYKSKDIIRDSAPFAISEHFENTLPATAANFGITFVAPSPCVVLAVSLRYTTASTSGTLDIERLQDTEALDSGDSLLASTISMSATANTTYDGTLKKTDAIFLRDGDALALKDGGTLTNLVGLCVTIKMRWV